jgi:hypothetical protein
MILENIDAMIIFSEKISGQRQNKQKVCQISIFGGGGDALGLNYELLICFFVSNNTPGSPDS